MKDFTEAGTQWQVHLFIDSSTALGTLLRGSSNQKDWNQLVTQFWFSVATSGILLGTWRVPSAQNLADAPTRRGAKTKEMQFLIDAGFNEVRWKWPKQWLQIKS
jgi:hypothetical protein